MKRSNVRTRPKGNARGGMNPVMGARSQIAAMGSDKIVSRSPYLQSLIDPVDGAGVKVPDSVTCPSWPVQGNQFLSVSTGAAGSCAGLAVYVGNLGTSTDLYTTTSASTAAAIGWTAANKSYAAGITATASASRPVSALLSVKPNQSTNTANGRMIVAFYPGASVVASSAGLPTTSAGLLDAPYVATIPVSKGYAECRYIPLDDWARSYWPTAFVPVRATTLPSGSNRALYGVLVIIVETVPFLTATEFQFIENLECIPSTNATSIASPTPSYSDPLELAAVSNILSETPEIVVEQRPEEMITGTAVSKGGPSFKIREHNSSGGWLDEALSVIDAIAGPTPFAPVVKAGRGIWNLAKRIFK
jgi:hypothetical protein